MDSTFTHIKHISIKFLIAVMVLPWLIISQANAQCGFAAGLGCPGTDYANYGYNSSPNAATLEYDNFISAFHSTVIRNSDGKFQIWGEQADADGVSPVLNPLEINSTNFPGLTGTPIKMAIASQGANHQKILLTTEGLFAWGSTDILISSDITNTTSFSKISINGKSDGLPAGVSPDQVKMLFAATGTLVVVTCGGDVYVLAKNYKRNQGDALSLHKTSWGRVRTGFGSYLTNVVAVRGSTRTLMALTADNEVYTWGENTLLGNETSYNVKSREFATKMTLPETTPIKMIGVTSWDKFHESSNTDNAGDPSYYILYANGNLYAMGNNELNQLGDFTTKSTPVTSGGKSGTTKRWVQPRYPNLSGKAGVIMSDVRWISPNEHDSRWPAISILNNDARIWNWGSNAGSMIGRTATGQDKNTKTSFNPGQPFANEAYNPVTSRVMTIETGGHTTMIIQECEENFGYVGHAIHGSTAAGEDGDTYYPKFIFNTATVQVCGTIANPEISFAATPVTGNNEEVVCKNQALELDGTPAGGVFTIESGPGTISDGNILTFDDGNYSGVVKIRYTVATSICANKYVEKIIPFEVCTIYKIKGKVWIDDNKNALLETGEVGTNGSAPGHSGLWANLVDENNDVVVSVKVSADGNYELPTTRNGTYSVHITNEKVGTGAETYSSLYTLPGAWYYTGNNRSNASVCLMPSCTAPYRIAGIIVNNADVEGINFGLLSDYSISGTVYHDANGLEDGSVNGIPVFTPGAGYQIATQPPLYISAIGPDGKVMKYVAVNSDGTYHFTFPGEVSVKLILGTTLPVVGNVPAAQTLPGQWLFMGEDFGVGNGSGTGINDGSGSGNNALATKKDGQIHVSFAPGITSVTNVDFGIELPPVADKKEYLNINPGEFKLPTDQNLPGFPAVNEYVSIPMAHPDLGPLTGSDPEDCPAAESCSTGKTFRVHSINQYTKLFYDFGGLRGVEEINPISNPVEITDFDPSKMVIYGAIGYGISSSPFQFTYSLVDEAGVQSVPVTYTITTFSILPVELVAFNARPKDGKVELTWATSSELNNREFMIERSMDAINWNIIATVPSKAVSGYSGERLNYRVVDSLGLTGKIYYRLKQRSVDGAIRVFEIQIVYVESPEIRIFPNPATSFVRITGLREKVAIKLFDYNGKQLKADYADSDRYTMDVNDLGKGVYNLVIFNPDGSIQSFKVYKK